MTARLSVRCPAKVNLSLRVLGRREDGYHELDTVFQAIDLWDTLEAVESSRLALRCDDPSVPDSEENLVLRAVELLRRHTGSFQPRVELRLSKRIPAQAGLGGGSSDAAGALVLGNRLWSLGLEREELGRIGAELGADVPFFLLGGTARGQGRGDRLTALPAAPPMALVLGFPPFGVPTAEAYRRMAERLTHPENGVSVPVHFPHKWPERNDFSRPMNDLEGVVFEGWPELERFRDALIEAGASRAMLSGSGSTVYGAFEERHEGERAVATLQAGFPRWRLVTTRTIRRAVELTEGK